MLLKKGICRDYFNDLTLEEMNAVVWIITMLRKAKSKHPKFSKGKIMYAQSIVLEEAGKLTRSVNRFIFETGSFDEMRLKTASVGATVVRMLELLERKSKHAADLRKKKPIECGCENGVMCATCKAYMKPFEGVQTKNENGEETKTQTPLVD